MKYLTLLFLVGCSINTYASQSCDALKSHGKIDSSADCKDARSNDVASNYALDKNGGLYRFVNGNKCQITSNVADMKISMHPQDKAMMYFSKESNLYVLNNPTGEELRKQCPKAKTSIIMSNVSKYNIVSNTNTVIVNVALSTSGKFVAWENSDIVFKADGIAEYSMNSCFGAKDKKFTTYVAFLRTAIGGIIIKVKGKNPAASKADDSKYYYDITKFKSENNVCK